MKKNYFAYIISVFLVVSPPAFSSDLEFYRGAFDVFKNELHPRLIDRLPSHERAIVDQLELVLIENPALVTLAGTAEISKKVYISVGFIDGLFNYIDCLLIEGRFNKNTICEDYFEYYFNKIASDKENPPWPVARIVFGNNTQLINKWANDPTLDQARKVMLFGALINVMVHEYGHHVIGFIDKKSSLYDMRELEGNIDKWAYSVLERMGESPALGATISVGYISQMERYRRILRERFANDPDFNEVTRIHPRPIERARWAYEHTCGDAGGNSALKNACDLLSRTIERFE